MATIEEQERKLEEMQASGVVNDFQAKELARTLAAAKGQANKTAAAYIERQEATFTEGRQEVLRALTEDVRDEAVRLTRAIAAGQVTDPAEAARRFDELRRRHEALVTRGSELIDRVAAVASAEEDPVAWADELARKYPSTAYPFGW